MFDVHSSRFFILVNCPDTTHGNHAYEIAKVLPLEYDAIVTVSGDGLIHEVMNGFAHHEYPMKAFSVPIAPIPTGSGNGLSLNILGLAVITPLLLSPKCSISFSTLEGWFRRSSRCLECN